jgi:hypothetical protein
MIAGIVLTVAACVALGVVANRALRDLTAPPAKSSD